MNELGVPVIEVGRFYFISYNSEDSARVSKYLKVMDRKGFPSWYDGGLHAGQKWESVLEERIRDCEAVVLFLSNHTFAKREAFVCKEWDIAISAGKKICTVLLEPINVSAIPERYKSWWNDIQDLQHIESYIFSLEDTARRIAVDVEYDEERIRFLNHSTLDYSGRLLSYVGRDRVLKIPHDVKCVGDSAFFGASLLEELTLHDGISSIGARAFENCRALRCVKLPTELEGIGDGAFFGCASLEKIEIPCGVAGIGANTFRDCSSLREISIPKGVEYIGERAFSRCAALTEVDIPYGVTYIGQTAFAECTSLSKVSIPITVNEIDEGAFFLCSSLCEIDYGGRECDWEEIGFGSHWDVPSIEYEYILGTASPKYTVVFSDFDGRAENFVIEDGKLIECNSSSPLLRIPDGIRVIGECAFSENETLKCVIIPESVTVIENGAFLGCDALCEIEIPSGVTAIPEGMVAFCERLSRISIPRGVVSIGRNAFYMCSSLEKIEFVGTKEEWEKIKFGDNWDGGASRYTVSFIE